MKRKLETVMGIILIVSTLLIGASGVEIPFDFFKEKGQEEHVEGTVSQNSENQEYCIVLDAGHGADDPGKVGPGGTLEKDINLKIVSELRVLLETQGYRVILTRENDEALYDSDSTNHKLSDMEKRVEIIENSNCDIAVSIHQNSYSDESVCGPQVFYYSTSKEGEILAAYIQKGFDYAIGNENRRNIKKNSQYYLLVHVKCPLVIAECGFLSNSKEEAELNTEEYQKAIAKSVFNGINDYFMSR